MTDEGVVQILKAINDFRDEFKEEKIKNEKRWEENNRRWEENDKRWEENDKRWEENDRRWKEHKADTKRNKQDIENILWSFQSSVENMYNENKNKIIKIQQLCSNCKMKAI